MKSSDQFSDVGTDLVLRRHPACRTVPYALDLHKIGLHCFPQLCGPIPNYLQLAPLLALLETLSSRIAVDREHQVLYAAWLSSLSVGSVYDIPTAPGWAVFQKAARTDLFIASLFQTTNSLYRVPKDLVKFDDIRPDQALPEVLPYTEMASVLYEACDSLMVDASKHDDIHLRNLYPHSVWTSGILFSRNQVRRLAPVSPPPRVFSRILECPVAGELLAMPGVVRCNGWITFFEALVPSRLEGSFDFDTKGHQRFRPRSRLSEKPSPASLLLEDLAFPELYYLILLEKIASAGSIRTVYHEARAIENTSLGLVNEFVDKSCFCESLGVHIDRNPPLSFSKHNQLAKASRNANRVLAFAEQFMCDVSSEGSECEEANMIPTDFVYKRDSRLDFSQLDGYEGWSDEEVMEKKYKAWSIYKPSVMLPAEVGAIFVQRGIYCYSADGKLFIVRCQNEKNRASNVPKISSVPDCVNWSDLLPLLADCVPDVENAADGLLLSLMVAGHVRLHGYFHCVDITEHRHMSRGITIFMDEPLKVLGFKVPEAKLAMLTLDRDCMIIPAGPACTILMRNMTEKYSCKHGRIHHSENVTVLPYGVRLGERRHLRWYAVGAGPWEPFSHPPLTLTEVAENELKKLCCSASSGYDHVVITAEKGRSSIGLREISIEAGWSSWSPHLIVAGKGKRISASVQTHSLPQLVDVLRRLRDSQKNCLLTLSIQEVAASIVLNETLIGCLRIRNASYWVPAWKTSNNGFVIAHNMSLPLGVGVREISAQNIGLLLTRDTMAVFNVAKKSDSEDVWRFRFVRIDNEIESEKLLLRPSFEGFVFRSCCGRIEGMIETQEEVQAEVSITDKVRHPEDTCSRENE